MATDTDRALSLLKEKVELLTGERANGNRRAVLIAELEALLKLFTDRTISLSDKIESDKQELSDEFWKNLLEEHQKISAEIDAAVAESSRQLKQAIVEARAAIDDARQSSQAARLEAHSVFQDAQTSITRLREESASAFAELAEIAETILDIRSDVDGNSAAITVEAGARATADLAIAGQITTINANIANNTAAVTSEAVARAAADSALSSRIDNVTAAAGGATAMVDAEATARVNADNALAAQITTVSAQASAQRVFNQSSAPGSTGRIVGDLWYDSSNGLKPHFWNGTAWTDNSDNRFTTIAAAVTAETTARTNADSAISAQITSLTSTVNGNVSAINNEAATRASADSALSSSLSSLTSTVNTNKATLDNEITTRANADTALSSSISSLTSTVNANKATLDQEIVTRANADSAISASVTSLTSTVNANKATLDQEIVTRANADSSLSARLTTVEASTTNTTGNGVLARLITEEVARANADTALSGRVSTIEASTTSTTGNGVLARIINEETARANADAAITSSVNTLTTSVNNNNASLSTLQSSYNGLAVKFGVTGTINGQTGGFVLTGIGKNDGSASYLLEIRSNVVIEGNLLVTGSTNFSKIASDTANKISNGGYVEAYGPSSVWVYCRAGAQILVIGAYPGGDDSNSAPTLPGFGGGGGGYGGWLRIFVARPEGYNTIITEGGIKGVMRDWSTNVTCTWLGCATTFTNYYTTCSSTVIGLFTPGVTGWHLFHIQPFSNAQLTTYFGRLTKLAVLELAR